MKLRRVQLMRLLLGIAMIALAAFFAAVIRNALAQQEPQNALPSLTVIYSTAEDRILLPADVVRRDKYQWRFMFWRREGGGKDLEIWREIPAGAWVPPNSSLELQFSYPPKSVQVYLKDGEGDFALCEGELKAPSTPSSDQREEKEGAGYVLRVDANWGEGRNITYYVKIRVPAW